MRNEKLEMRKAIQILNVECPIFNVEVERQIQDALENYTLKT